MYHGEVRAGFGGERRRGGSSGRESSDSFTAHMIRASPATHGLATSAAGVGTTSTEHGARPQQIRGDTAEHRMLAVRAGAGADHDEVGGERISTRHDRVGHARVLVEEHLDLQPVGA